MDASEALADLMEISSHVEAAVVLDAAGDPVASTIGDETRTAELARAARDLLSAAAEVRGAEGPALTQLDAATRAGSVVVVREGGRAIAATTAPGPTVGLVLYDLKTCLRALDADEKPEPKPAPRRRRKREEGGDEAA